MSKANLHRAKPDYSGVTKNNAVAIRLLNDYASLFTWAGVGAKYGVSSGMAFRVAVQGYVPKTAIIRHKLGFPELAPAPGLRPRCLRYPRSSSPRPPNWKASSNG